MNIRHVLVLCTLTSGCAGETIVSDTLEPTGTTRAAIRSMSYFSWGTGGNDGPALDLGPSTDRTCFLQGITGELDGREDSFSFRARASVLVRNARWVLETRAGRGSGVMGHATCIPTVNQRRSFTWTGNTVRNSQDEENEAVLASSGPLTQCFLTEVTATTGFRGVVANVRLDRSSTSDPWTLGGFLVPELDGDAGGTATAVCVDILEVVKTWKHTGPYPSGGNSGFLYDIADTTCGVGYLRGEFASSPTAWTEGARLFEQFDNWRAFASSGRTIGGHCYRDYF